MERLHRLCIKMVPSHGDARLTEHPRLLRIKTVSSPQDAWSCGVIRHAVCPRTKKEAAKKFPDHRKTLMHSPHHHVKTTHRLPWRCMGTKTRFHRHDGIR